MTLDDPIELGSGVLRLGTRVPTGGTVSWTPVEEGGALPLNVYVVRGAESALVIDTGPAVLYPELAEQIDAACAGRAMHVLVTRNDPEAMGGVGELLPHHGVRTFYYYGGGSILEWVWDSVAGPGASGDLFARVPIASPPVIELPGLGPIDVIHPPLAVLSTVWLYHRASGALFTSDAFGYLRPDTPADAGVVDDVGDVDAARARAYVAARFDWIERINNTRLVDELRAVLDPLDITVLAPSHGVVVSGRGAVRRYLDVLHSVLGPGASIDG